MPKLTIDGKEVTVEKGQTVMNAAEKLGIDIPRFCYHPNLSVAGNCRMCLVDIEKIPKLLTSCTTEAAEGMVVHTTTDKVKDAQRVVLEFLLVNHPIDCPICDKAGECPLQDQYYKFSSEPSRMEVEKTHKPKRVDLGPTIKLDQERCVLCTRCVRFLEEFADDHSLGTVNRGDRTILTTFPGQPLDNVYSLNTVDVCPVGALTSKDFRFKKRVWFLKKTPSICTFCATGCNINVEHDEGHVYRIRPRENDGVNGPWMCDTGRLEYTFVNSEDRVKCCLVRGEDHRQSRSGWDEVLKRIAEAILHAGNRAAGIASPRMTNESLYEFGRFFQMTLKSQRFAAVTSDIGPIEGRRADDFLIRADKNPNRRGVEEILPHFDPQGEALQKILEAAEAGKLPFLLILDQDLLSRVEDHQRWHSALEKVSCLVVGSTLENELTKMAHIVLPLASWVEEEGTYTRFDGRVQRVWRAFPARGEARETLALFNCVAAALGKKTQAVRPQAVFDELASRIRFYGGLSYPAIGKDGALGAGGETVVPRLSYGPGSEQPAAT